MGRNRTFVEADVIARSAGAFRTTGYEGTSIDDLVQATGLHRGSLYKAFGSKRGLFVMALQDVTASSPGDNAADLLLVALMELAPRDPEVRSIVFEILGDPASPHTADSLGRRLLDRASAASPTSRDHQETP
jgi:TetR/AcrR family transcriptional repressor of nem operon